MAKITYVEFEVHGQREFPYDMLRYDGCYPASGDDAAKLYSDVRERRIIRLRMPILGGNAAARLAGPTIDRWSSFGWSVDRDSVRRY